MSASQPAPESSRAGIVAALAAFFLWGVLPLYWKQLDFLAPGTIVAQRTVWSLALLVPLLGWSGDLLPTCRSLRDPRAAAWHLLSGLLLSGNWLLYVWATLNGRIIEASLGYYLNPFFNMLFGTLWFHERHSRPQLIAIGLALSGVLLQVPAVGHFPWVALVLALTFALYAVVRKRAPLGALAGLTVETALLAPLAAGWLLWGGIPLAMAFGKSPVHWLLVAGTGLATVLPLLCFGHATRRLRLTTLGILQFLGPTLQFLIGWLHYGEPMTLPRLLSFALIWLAVAIYAANALGSGKRHGCSERRPNPQGGGLPLDRMEAGRHAGRVPMKHRDISDPIAWARRINPVWKVRHGLDQVAEEWMDHLQAADPERLRICCEVAAFLSRGPGYGSDPKPWFYGGLFSLATREEGLRFLSNHRLTSAIIPALAHEPKSEQWVAGLSVVTRELIKRLRTAIGNEVATRWQGRGA